MCVKDMVTIMDIDELVHPTDFFTLSCSLSTIVIGDSNGTVCECTFDYLC